MNAAGRLVITLSASRQREARAQEKGARASVKRSSLTPTETVIVETAGILIIRPAMPPLMRRNLRRGNVIQSLTLAGRHVRYRAFPVQPALRQQECCASADQRRCQDAQQDGCHAHAASLPGQNHCAPGMVSSRPASAPGVTHWCATPSMIFLPVSDHA